MPRAILSFDLHASDDPSDIGRCLDWLAEAGIRASFFIPSRLLLTERYIPALRRFRDAGHEIGAHGHEHDWAEMNALRRDDAGDLGFLEYSTKALQDFFGVTPRAFRTPCWCGASPRALDELARLGYTVDSSATPQRPGILSSFPGESPYLWTRRSPHFVRPTLLEVPTSCFLLPLAAPAFQALRRGGSVAFTRMFLLEARLVASRVVVAQLHVGDLFVGHGQMPARARLTWRHLVPWAVGGFGARDFIRMRDRGQIARMSQAVIRTLQTATLMTYDEVWSAFRP